MSFWAHLDVLRRALFRVLAVYAAVFIVFICIMPHIFTAVILGPASGDFFVYKWLNALPDAVSGFAQGFHVRIINIDIAAQLMTHLNTSMTLAAIVCCPYIIYELWRYIRPALYSNELRRVKTAFALGTVMFFAGCLVGYVIVFPFTFRALAEYQISEMITNQISLSSYINYFTAIILIMGLVFEMPLVVWLLGCLGLIDRPFLRRYRRHAVVVLLVLAALITPSGDPFSLLIVFLPLYLLYELSIFMVCKSKEPV
ncbi:MAG: twin-arginine translocase subunit TatC [Prevotella sp.]|nr:twin-arginine translocase subunit TatC [Prevotella sp.]